MGPDRRDARQPCLQFSSCSDQLCLRKPWFGLQKKVMMCFFRIRSHPWTPCSSNSGGKLLLRILQKCKLRQSTKNTWHNRPWFTTQGWGWSGWHESGTRLTNHFFWRLLFQLLIWQLRDHSQCWGTFPRCQSHRSITAFLFHTVGMYDLVTESFVTPFLLLRAHASKELLIGKLPWSRLHKLGFQKYAMNRP